MRDCVMSRKMSRLTTFLTKGVHRYQPNWIEVCIIKSDRNKELQDVSLFHSMIIFHALKKRP